MTDNEIIKALECCVKGLECKNCPANPHKGNYGYCTSLLLKDALDLINRQKAEIERLKGMVSQNEGVLPRYEQLIKAEAIKEFAERLKEKHRRITDYDEAGFGAQIFIVEEKVIDNLLKEMESDN